ncbi:MAG TPA: toxin-antitoxin system YwqK family antitoxin [Bacteroidia bacterium]|nr:toxin-antitoxin system YwqK family antitoxin [Bacteroidia bacterium]
MNFKPVLRILFPQLLHCGLFLLPSIAIGQKLSFRMTGNEMNAEIYSQGNGNVVLHFSLDSAGKRDGAYTLRKLPYSGDTLPLFTGQFRSGKLVDTAYWYRDGWITRKAVFAANGSNTDAIPFTEFFEFDLRGTLEGPCMSYEYVRGKGVWMSALDEYHAGEKNGLAEKFYQNGQLKQEFHFVNDKREGEYESWLEDGTLYAQGNYLKDEKSGKWKYFDSTGVLSQTSTYINGRESDTTFTYYRNGSVHSIALMKDGRRVGNYFENDSLGNRSLYSHFNRYGNMDSVAISYFPSGRMKFLIHYSDGEWNGKYTTWYPNGNVDSTGDFRNNVPVGVWKFYNEKGKLLRTVHHDKDFNAPIPTDTLVGIDDYLDDAVFYRVEQPATVKNFSGVFTVQKEDHLKFLKSYSMIDLDARVSYRGQVEWHVNGAMAVQDKILLENYLNAKYPLGTPMNVNGRPYESVLHYKVIISKK